MRKPARAIDTTPPSGAVSRLLPPDMALYVARVVRNWITFWGGLLMAIVALAFGEMGQVIPAGVVGLLAILAVSLAQYRAYREIRSADHAALFDLTTKLAAAEKENVAHRDRLRPKLRFHFAGRVDPYYFDYPDLIKDLSGNPVRQRGFRVAVYNDSTADIPNVQALLRDASNKTGGVFVGHNLTFMGHGNDKTITARAGTEPVFVNIVAQNVDPNYPERHAEFFYYAESQLIGQIGHLNQTITVVVQGGGVEDEISFNLMLDSDGAIQLIALPKPAVS